MGEKITTAVAAKRLGVTRARVHHFISEKRLPAVKFGNAYMIDADDLAAVESRPGPGRPVSKPKPKK